MLYIKLNELDHDSLVYYCRKCGENNKLIDKNNVCVLKTEFLSNEKSYKFEINEFTKYDYTLPRTTQIKCPNVECPNKDSDKNEIIYMRYDDKNMNYVYMCTVCDKIWKTNE
jgi:DNA-directed RNA polymerase subunit M/transcription elongation factor TFIIS